MPSQKLPVLQREKPRQVSESSDEEERKNYSTLRLILAC